MDLSAVLTTHIDTLTGLTGVDDQLTTQAVAALADELKQAVASFLGLQLSLVDHDHSVVLSVFEPTVELDQIGTSLRLTLAVLGIPGADPASTITFYAGVPGAFVDLAADLSYALGAHGSAFEQDRVLLPDTPPAISLDNPLLPTTVETGLTGAADLSTINRAIGILIGGGHDPVEAHIELGRLAAAAGLSPLGYATHLVRPSRTK